MYILIRIAKTVHNRFRVYDWVEGKILLSYPGKNKFRKVG